MSQATTVERMEGGSAGIGIRAGNASRRKGLLKQTALGTLAVLGLAAGAYYGTEYWQTGRFQVSTDDAYVQADNTLIAPRVSGYISQVLVTDNQPVKAGQVLARIDDQDFQTALHQAIADRESAESEIRSIDAQLILQNSMIEQASQRGHLGRGRAEVRRSRTRPGMTCSRAPVPGQLSPRSRPSPR